MLKEYLETRELEVVDMMMTLFDDEYILEAYARDIQDEEARKIAERMIKMGKLSLEEIALCVPALSLDELKEIETNVLQQM